MNVIRNIYANVKSCVFVNGEKSPEFECLKGVRQGENLSPILFSLYVNDLEKFLLSKGSTFFNFKDMEINNFLKLLVILYADDTVILANNASDLQQALQNLEQYCKMWKLTVNPKKTKITIFSSRKVNANTLHFTYNGKPIEIVDSFKYLGIMFKYNGKFDECKKRLYDQASKAMFSLLSKSHELDLPLDIRLELFDRMIIPILIYGCEIWGYEDLKIIEKLHTRFLKYILKLKNSTPNCLLYGELGRYPIEILIKCRTVCYWHKLINGNRNKFVYKIYKVFLVMFRENIYKASWLTYVKNILDECGLSNVWINQGAYCSTEALKKEIKLRLQDQFKQMWHADISNSSKCVLYKFYKTNFEFENYMLNLKNLHCKLLIKFRLCNHKFSIEKGRYNNIERHRRYCDICNEDKLGDEYHVLMECKHPILINVRKRTICKCVNNINVHEFCKLMESLSTNIKNATMVAIFLKEVSRSFRCI